MKYIKSIILFVLAFSITLVVLDRYLLFSEINSTSQDIFDKRYGKIFRPGRKFSAFNEGFSIGEVNDYSYLYADYPRERKPGTYRIALLGDSYIEGFQLFARNHLATIMEENLNSGDSQIRFEVLNFGRSGFTLESMYAQYKTFVGEFKPDRTLFFLAEADFYDEVNDALTLGYVVDNDSLKLKKFSEGAIKKYKIYSSVTQYSPYFTMLNSCRRLAASGNAAKILLDKFAPSRKQGGGSDASSKKVSSKVKMILEKVSSDSNIVIVNRSDEPYNEEIAALLIKNGITPVEIPEVIEKLEKQGMDPHYWSATNKTGHWNYITHREIGDFLSEKLREIIK